MFKPMTVERPKCLFPLANIPVLLYSLEFLAVNNVTDVILVSSKEGRVFKQVLETIRAAHSNKKNRIAIKTFKLDKANSLAAALREINDSQEKLSENFIIMQGDVVTNASLKDAIQMHLDGKKTAKNEEGASVVMTKIFVQMPFADPVRNTQQELALLLDAETRQILDYGQYGSRQTTSYQLNKKHISLKKQARQYELRSDLVDTEIAICSKQIFTHLQEDYTMRSLKEDFIMQLNTSEITED